MESYIVEEYNRLSEDATQLGPYIEIDLANLQEALVNHAAGYVYLAQHAAAAKGQATAAKNKVDAIKGELFYAYKTAKQEGTKTYTDETVKSMVSKDPQMQQARVEQALADMGELYWTAVMSAMNQRGYFLRELFQQDQRNSCAERQYPSAMHSTMEDLQTIAEERTQLLDNPNNDINIRSRAATEGHMVDNIMSKLTHSK